MVNLRFKGGKRRHGELKQLARVTQQQSAGEAGRSHIAGGDGEQYRHLEDRMTVPEELKHRTAMSPSHATADTHPRTENTHPRKNTHMQLHSSILYYRQEQKQPKCSTTGECIRKM